MDWSWQCACYPHFPGFSYTDLQKEPLTYAKYLCSVSVGGKTYCDTCASKKAGVASAALLCTGEALRDASSQVTENEVHCFDGDAKALVCATSVEKLRTCGFVELVCEKKSAKVIAADLESLYIQGMREVLVGSSVIVRFETHDFAQTCAFELAQGVGVGSGYQPNIVTSTEWMVHCRDSDPVWSPTQVIYCGGRFVLPKPSRDIDKRVVCPRGHSLEYVTEKSGLCDGCMNSNGVTNRESWAYRCKRCDYDLCRACYRSRGGDAHDKMVQRERSPEIRELQVARERHESHWGRKVDWSRFAKVVAPGSVATLQELLVVLKALPMYCRSRCGADIKGFAIHEGIGYLWFRHRVGAQRLAQEAYEHTGRDGGSSFYLCGTVSFHLEPLSEDEWLALLEKIPTDPDETTPLAPKPTSRVGNAKAAWENEQRLWREVLEKSEKREREKMSEPGDTTTSGQVCSNECPTLRTIKFQAGPMGINYHTGTGQVRSLVDSGQAKALGVKVDWIIVRLEGKDFNQELVNKVTGYRRQYSITFETNFKKCRELRSGRLDCLETASKANAAETCRLVENSPSSSSITCRPLPLPSDSAMVANGIPSSEAEPLESIQGQSDDVRKDSWYECERLAQTLQKRLLPYVAFWKKTRDANGALSNEYTKSLQCMLEIALHDIEEALSLAEKSDVFGFACASPKKSAGVKKLMHDVFFATIKHLKNLLAIARKPTSGSGIRGVLAEMCDCADILLSSLSRVLDAFKKKAQLATTDKVKSAQGKYVSAKKVEAGKKHCGHLLAWTEALKQSRLFYGLVAGAKIKKGTKEYLKAREFYNRSLGAATSSGVAANEPVQIVGGARKRMRSKGVGV